GRDLQRRARDRPRAAGGTGATALAAGARADAPGARCTGPGGDDEPGDPGRRLTPPPPRGPRSARRPPRADSAHDEVDHDGTGLALQVADIDVLAVAGAK